MLFRSIPALGRPVTDDPDFDVELVYGARRLFVAKHLNVPLAVEVRPIPDREAIIAIDAENRLRSNVSPYERGRCYQRWLQGKHFASQDEIARTLQVSASQVSRLLRIARLPSVVVGAFASVTDICETWGLALADGWEDPQRQSAIARRARALSQLEKRPAPEQIYRDLLEARAGQHKSRPSGRDNVVKDADGVSLFRVRQHRDSVCIVLPVAKVAAVTLRTIVAAVTSALQEQATAAAMVSVSGSRLLASERPCRQRMS